MVGRIERVERVDRVERVEGVGLKPCLADPLRLPPILANRRRNFVHGLTGIHRCHVWFCSEISFEPNSPFKPLIKGRVNWLWLRTKFLKFSPVLLVWTPNTRLANRSSAKWPLGQSKRDFQRENPCGDGSKEDVESGDCVFKGMRFKGEWASTSAA